VAITICVLLSALPGCEQPLARYEDEVLELLGEHQGQVIARLRALDGPFTEIQVLEFESDQSLTAFQEDPRHPERMITSPHCLSDGADQPASAFALIPSNSA
jgi:hypothetical protein